MYGGWPQSKSGFQKNAALAAKALQRLQSQIHRVNHPPPSPKLIPNHARMPRARSAPPARASGLGTDCPLHGPPS
eukprot:5151692-Pyramimonas_sp.AAC.1